MPSDPLRQRAMEALASRRDDYRSAVATAVDEIRSLLEMNRGPGQRRKGERAAVELGAFAAGRIDPERFESFLSDRPALDPHSVERIEEALETMSSLLHAGDDLFFLRVPSGADLHTAVRQALAEPGRAFGAGRAVANAPAGTASVEYAHGFDPLLWNRAERTVAPPMVVEVDGADLRPAALVDLLEGRQAVVLLVKKPAPPAALARLITPGTLVAQGPDGDVLDALPGWDGPAVVAVVPEGAVFQYHPEEDGPGTLTVGAAGEAPCVPIGGLSAARQESDLGLLQLLSNSVSAQSTAAAAGAEAASDPADKLAAWLLRQATIPDPGGA